MKLGRLLENVEVLRMTGASNMDGSDIEITNIVYDSRNVVPGCVFVAITGTRSDGHDYLEMAVEKGAAALVVEQWERAEPFAEKVPVAVVEEARKALAYMSAAYFDYPQKKLTTIGITGTKGKTTTAYMIYSVLSNAGIKTGLIGTIETLIGEERIASDNTTPISYLLYQYFDRMVKTGCTCVVMEVSSQGLKQYRVGGICFDYAVLTNIEPDHIGPGEHASFEEYMECKGLLFRSCKTALVNIDDTHWKRVLGSASCKIKTYSANGKKADFYAENIKLHAGLEGGGLSVAYHLGGETSFDIQVNIPGKFTVYNSMTAAIICLQLGIEEKIIQDALLNAKVRGRVEIVPISDNFTVMVDYAHNAMSLQSLLDTMKEYYPKRLICLFGCGGNRSRDRRFEMGEISSRCADLTIVTSDNPRFEEPEAIIADIITGVKKGGGNYISIIDRREAIFYCLEHAKQGDVIIIAGKGHEDYQEICGVKHHMDDRELVMECAEKLGYIR